MITSQIKFKLHIKRKSLNMIVLIITNPYDQKVPVVVFFATTASLVMMLCAGKNILWEE